MELVRFDLSVEVEANWRTIETSLTPIDVVVALDHVRTRLIKVGTETQRLLDLIATLEKLLPGAPLAVRQALTGVINQARVVRAETAKHPLPEVL